MRKLLLAQILNNPGISNLMWHHRGSMALRLDWQFWTHFKVTFPNLFQTSRYQIFPHHGKKSLTY